MILESVQLALTHLTLENLKELDHKTYVSTLKINQREFNQLRDSLTQFNVNQFVQQCKQKLICEYLTTLAEQKKKIVLYGAGKFTKKILQLNYQANKPFEVTAILDDQASTNQTILGTSVIKPMSLKKTEDTVIFISTDSFINKIKTNITDKFSNSAKIELAYIQTNEDSCHPTINQDYLAKNLSTNIDFALNLQPIKKTKSKTTILARNTKIQHYLAAQKPKKYALVTAIFGAYDTLKLPNQLNSNIDYICFTDCTHQDFGVWQLRQSPYFNQDPVRIARYIKTHLHELLENYDAIVWVDANIQINCDLSSIIQKHSAQKSQISFIEHPYRNCLFAEAITCSSHNRDKPEIISAQIQRYIDKGHPINWGLYETNFFIINPQEQKVRDCLNYWWAEIKNYSRRDQISVSYACRISGVKINRAFDKGLCMRTHPDFQWISHSQQQTSPHNANGTPSFEQIATPQEATTANYKSSVIICVFNALEDVKKCLNSVLKHDNQLAEILIVNDCSNQETKDYLEQQAKIHQQIQLINNQQNLGYVKSANIGLKNASSELKVLLNSDTIVTKNWLVKLLKTAFKSPTIGIVGPLSNAASYQSIPSIKGSVEQTAINSLPSSLSADDINSFCESFSKYKYQPAVPLIHGFCIAIKSSVIEQIGYFDEINFERYYGEENDFCIRAYKAGFEMAIDTSTFIFHKKSMSINEEERLIHIQKAGEKLRTIHGQATIQDYCTQLGENPYLKEVREATKIFIDNHKDAIND